MKCYTGLSMKKLTVVWVREDFSLSTSTCFFYIKTQASGYPKQRQEYIEEYASNEGVILDPKLIEGNPGLCSIAKLALNSFYGKFGQHSNMSMTAHITCYEKLYDFLTDQPRSLKTFTFMIWVWLL